MAYTLTYTLNSDGNSYTLSGYSGDAPTGELVIPDSYDSKPVTSIGTSAFSNCYKLTSITIPNSVTSIGQGAFLGCYELTSITIGSGVTSIGRYAFAGCSGLTSISVASGNTKYHSNGNCLIETETKTLILGCKTSIIPTDGSVTSIGDYAFSDCYKLTSITIPNSVTSIGDSAFKGCTNLMSITIPDSVTSIGNNAFSNCNGLMSITIPDSVTSIGNTAFLNCRGLTSIVIPDSVTSIGDDAFVFCSGLTSITIGSGVTSIGSYAFAGCSGLTSIVVVSGNTKYHSNGNCLIETETKTLILGCKTSVIPSDDSVTSIGAGAFSGCSGLTSVTIPVSVTWIGNYAFSGCTGLMSITIPDSVTSIGYDAFQDCSSLQYNTYDSAKYLGNSNNPYVVLIKANNTSIASCEINENTKFISDEAFYNCSGLTSITIPDSVTSIGPNAFYKCSGLTKINMLPTTPPTIQNNTLDATVQNIYVPSKSGEAYKTATNWNTYANKITEFPLLDLSSLLLYNNKVKEKIDALDEKTGASIDLSIDTSTYVMTVALKNADGTIISSGNIDFPLESVVVNATYESGILTLVLQNGNSVNVDISDIISGLVAEDGDGSNLTASFTESATRTNITTGEKLSVLFGKIKKWFTDLKSLAFKSKTEAGDYTAGSITSTDTDSTIAKTSDLSGLVSDVQANGVSVVSNRVANITKSSLGLGNVNNTADVNKVVHGATVLTNQDLNNYNTASLVGWYYAAGGNSVTNKPSGVNEFGLEVIRAANGVFVQRLTYGNKIYQRTYGVSSWNSWIEFANTTGTYSGMTVGNATNATNATNVDTNINGKAITSIFESDGITVKKATNATNAINATNDSNGRKIVDTYAKQNGTYPNMTVGNATNATNDSDGNKFANTYAKKTEISNPNLLINPDFSINQRGQKSYSKNGYTVDRWRLYQGSGACVVTPRSNGGIAVNNSAGTTFATFRQYYEEYSKLAGKTVTVSCHINSFTGAVRMYLEGVKSATQYSANLTVGQNKLTITCDSTTTQIQIGFNLPAGASIDVAYMKLEIGSTATEFIPPLIAEELPKCQRYGFLLASGPVRYPNTQILDSTIDFTIPTPVSLMTPPTLSDTANIVVYDPDNAMTVQSGFTFEVVHTTSNAICIRAEKSAHGLSRAVLGFTANVFLDAEI